MPINPLQFVSALEPSNITTPLEGKRSRLLVDADEMKIAQARRAIDREQKLDRALQQMGPNVTAEGIQGIMRADPRIGIQMQDKYNEEQNWLRDDQRATDAAKRVADEAERKQKEAADHAKLTRAALSISRIDPKDMAGRQTAIDMLLKRGDIDEDDAAGLLQASPEQFEAHRSTLEGIALDPDKFTKLMEERRQGQTAASQNAQRAAQLPGEQADAQGKVLATAAQRLLALPPPARAIALQSMEKEAPGISQYFPAEVLADSGKLRSVGLTPVQQIQQDTLTQTGANQKAQRDIDLQRLGIERAGLNLRIKENQQKTQGSLGVLSETQKSLAQKVADGDLTVQQLSRLPDKEAIVAGAIELNPDWSSNTAATKKAFTDPASKQSQNLGTISRIVGHIGRFEKNSADLGTSPSLLTGVSLTGEAAKTANDARAIASELEKLVSGGVGTVGQVKEWESELLSSREGIRKAALDEISQLMGSQFEGMNQTYKAGLGKDLPLDQFATPESKKWLAKQGINVTGAAPKQAAVPTVTTKEQYDALPDGAEFIEDGKRLRKGK